MVKDATPIKKKRKTANSGDNEGEIDIYRKVVDFEEKEASIRDSDVDASFYSQVCTEIRQNLAEIYDINSDPKQQNSQKKQELLLDVCLKIAVIKKLNRIDKIQHVFGKDALNVEKQKCDSIKLVYQNLVYELNHLMHEVTKCNSFKSKHEDIDLIDFKDFIKEGPSNLTEKFKTVDFNNAEDMHNLTLARLEYELQQRKSLAKTCESLQEEKKKLAADIVERKNKLEGLLPLLNTIINATKPLQEYLNIPIDKVRAEQKLAQLLPDPLYIFYANVVAYSNVYGKADVNLKAVILGDQEEAAQFNETASLNTNLEDIESDVDHETQETEEIVEVKKRRHRKSMQVDPMEEKKKKLVEVHPLSIEVILEIKGIPAITLTLKYCTRLKIVTVTSRIDLPSSITGNCAQEILTGDHILSELTPGDLGTQSPNPNTPYQLRKVALGSFESLIPQIGYAYNWAQASCGLDFLSKKVSSEEAGRANVDFVFKTLNKRLTSRTDLANQLQKLEQNLIPEIPDTVEVPQNIISGMTKFSSSSYQSFCQADHAKALVEDEFVSHSDMYFTSTISRNNAQLQTFIVIKNSYPSQQPIFCLCLSYKGLKYHSANSDDIRDMERAINLEINKDSVKSGILLAVQMTYLCSFLDVFLETNYPRDFPQSTMFLKNICARNRRSPFKFRKIGTGIFTQY